MKKYLLGLLAIPLGFIAFSSAFSVTCEDGNCTPNEIEVGPGICNNGITNITFNGSVECEDQEENVCFINFYNNDNNFFGVGFRDGEIDLENSTCNFEGDSNKTFTIDSDTVINLNGLTFNGGGNTGGGDNGGNEGGNTGGGLVAGGVNAFSGIITRLGDIFGEFGPYIIYIAIACIGISLLFKALKSLLGFTSGKAKNSIGGRAGMKERRKRRRQLRRRTYSQNDVNKARRKSDYYYIGNGRYKRRTTQRRKKFGGTLNSFDQSKKY